jgi:hypothetical protein
MFTKIRSLMQGQFNKIVATGKLYTVDPDRDKVWLTYLDAFSEEFRQENNCNCCKSFLRQYGGIVGIDDKNQIITLWDFETDDPEYASSIKALGDYIRSLPIKGIFLNTFKKCGTEKNADTKRSVIWDHFYFELPNPFVVRENHIGPLQGTSLDNKNVLERSLNEITDDAVDTVLELIGQNSLYRGNEFKGMVDEFKKIKVRYKKVKASDRKNFCWTESTKVGQAVTRIRNSSIGTLLNDLSAGKDLDKAVAAFERVVAPTNYKRPTAIATPRMIEDARKRLEELGLVGALNRRLLSDRDLTVDNALFVYRPTQLGGDIFDQLKKDVTINPKTLSKVEEVSIEDFVNKVLPTAKSVSVLVENSHLGNFASLVGPQNPDEPSLFKWNNSFSWSYSGEVADSIKERVKAAGGNVEGVLRISLSWDNKDDLDLHLFEPVGSHVNYSTRNGKSGACLDVDANGLDGLRDDPVENIYWTNLPSKEGRYRVMVNNYNKREARNQGYTLEIEYDGQTYHWSSDTNHAPNKTIVEFDYSRKNGITFVGGKESSVGKYNSKEKWGIKTGQFVNVRAMTLSPNHWTNAVGNKHYFFFLEDCKTDEKTRGFYNEFLRQDLDKDRKVFELLASKVVVEGAENELSGLGFSDTSRNHIYAKVKGTFERVIKIKF